MSASHLPAHPPPTTTTATIYLPTPQTFDILPALHELLARMNHTTAPINSHSPTHHLSTHLSTPSDPSTHDAGSQYVDLLPLEPSALPTEILQIKAKIRAALRELGKLPDMQRGVEEQEVEIRELEERIREQRAMVRGIGQAAEKMQKDLG